MSDIDPERLEQHIAWFREHWVGRNLVGFPPGTIEVLNEIADAADKHLATLPRLKEVEIEQFAVVRCDGRVMSVWGERANAESYAAGYTAPHEIIRLTGTAKVKVTP